VLTQSSYGLTVAAASIDPSVFYMGADATWPPGDSPENGGVRWTARDGEAIVVLTGEHDLATRDVVEMTLRAASAGSSRLVVDLSACTFIDCSVIAVINDAAASVPVAVHAPEETAATVRLLLALVEEQASIVHPAYALEAS
jgi:hypothetical protein